MTFLKLSHQKLSNAGLAELTHLTRLRELNIEMNGISGDATACLSRLTNLSDLNICNEQPNTALNSICDEGAFGIARGLPRLIRLSISIE